MAQFLESPQLALPAATTSPTVTSSTTPWASSSWVEIDPSIANDAVLTAVSTYNDVTLPIQFEVDVGVGGAGSEVVVSTIKGISEPPLGDVGDDTTFVLPIPVEAFTSGDRVAVRVRTSASAANSWPVGLSIVEVPFTGTMMTTAQPVKVLPSAAAFTDLNTGGSAWTSGSWVEMTASAAADLVVVGFGTRCAGQCEFDLGIGGAGSEVVIATIRGFGGNGRNGQIMFHSPWDAIPSGSRIAARSRAATVTLIRLSFMYQEQPL